MEQIATTPGPSRRRLLPRVLDARPERGVPAAGAPVPDDVLARRAALGDRDAFAALVDRHGAALHRYAWRMLDDPEQTQDCLQDAFADAWRGLPGFRGEASVRTWLFTLTAHAVRRHQRRPSSRSATAGAVDELEALPAPTSTDPARVVEMAGFVVALDGELRRLPELQRAAWLLREVDDLSYADIAHVLAVPTDTVRGLLARARTTLTAAMGEWR